MLTRLEPELARAVEAELKRVGELSATEIESVVAEFLTLNGGNGFDAASERRTLLPNLTKIAPTSAKISRSRSNFGEENDKSKDDFDGLDDLRKTVGFGELDALRDLNAFDDDFQALDAFEPETIAEILRDESAVVVAVVASRLAEERRVKTLKLLPPELADDASRLAAALERRTETAQFLEDAVFNRAF